MIIPKIQPNTPMSAERIHAHNAIIRKATNVFIIINYTPVQV